MQPYDIACGDIMKARMLERRRVFDEKLTVMGAKIEGTVFKTEYALHGAELLASFEDGTPALQRASYGKGEVYLCGFSLGHSSYGKRKEGAVALIEYILARVGVVKEEFSDFRNGVYEKRCLSDKYEIVHLINCSGEEKSFACGAPVAVGGSCKVEDGKFILADRCMGYYVIERK